ncbi:uncharacterized protein DUF4907 [Nonlabens dokdonensis]|jgi:hypothetical protein|nr:uncharacterized protein DUF4907 [Nonlabens dokdonensis]
MLLFISGCRNNDVRKDVIKKDEEKISVYQYNIIGGENSFGFQIIFNNSVVIEQKHIPAINGASAFKSEEDATMVAELMIYKLNNKIFPPSVTVHELDSLNIKYEN